MGYHMRSTGRFADVQDLNLLPSAARASSGSGSGVETGDRRVARLTLDVTAADTPTSLDVTIETSPDGTNWYTSGTFTQVTSGSSSERKLFMLDRFVRASWAVVGTSFTFSVGGETA